jgi:hypothetical protein
MKQQFRIRRFNRRNEFSGFQLLQEKRWWGWQTIDREEIPHHVIISLGAFGDTGGWVTKFAAIGTFDGGDKFTPHDPSRYARQSIFKRLLNKIRNIPLSTRQVVRA